MEHSILRKFLLIAVLFVSTNGYANSFEVDGIFYAITPSKEKTVKVTSGKDYSGNINIPSTIFYNSNTYTVTSIDNDAFSACHDLTSVTIPNTVTYIGRSSFYSCTNLTSITIPNSVISIGSTAFLSCNKLASVNIGNSVESIGVRAFEGCSSLTSLSIGASITDIGSQAFNYCYNLSSIIVDSGNNVYDSRNDCNAIIETTTNTLILGCQNTIIPNTVTNIENYAFIGCYHLATLTIPSSIKSIGTHAFSSCLNLSSIDVEKGNPTYDSRENCNAIIETATNTLVVGCQNTIIPNTVTRIGDCAFSDCSELKYIMIPNSVTEIGNSAFEGCRLINISIPSSVKSIGEYALNDVGEIRCESSIPATIHSNTFSETIIDGRIYVPKNSKGTYASANGWSSFNNYNIIEISPDFTVDGINYQITSTTDLTAEVIYNLNFYSNDISIPSTVTYNNKTYSVTSINANAFHECGNLTSVKIGNSISCIPESAFASCHRLTSVNLGNSITSIENHAFVYCSSLTSITIPNSTTSIGISSFTGCTNLTSVNLGNSVTEIGEQAFTGCKNLTFIDIPSSVTNIGHLAFEGCNLTSIFIPKSVTSIGSGAFLSYNLASIIVDKENPKYDSRHNCNAIIDKESQTLIVGCKNTIIPSSVTHIGNDAFWGISSMVIPSNIITIGDLAFFDCRELTSIIIPNSVTTIGYSTFEYCGNLKSINIGNSVTNIGDYAFASCYNLTEIISNNNTPPVVEPETFMEVPSTTTIYVPSGSKEAYEEAEGWCNFNIVEFDSNFIVDGIYYKITSIENSTVEVIKKDSGKYSGDIKIPSSINLNNKNYSVTSIGELAFNGCNEMTSISIPNTVINLGYRALYNCSALTSVTIPNSVRLIAERTFNGCSGLTSLTFGDSVEYIGWASFCRCSSLTSVTLPASIICIGDLAFSGCNNLETIYIPDCVTRVCNESFSNCSNITSVIIGESVTNIGDKAFHNCEKLASVYCKAITPPTATLEVDYATFQNNTLQKSTLYVPQGTKALYESVAPWCNFKNIKEQGASGIESDLVDNDVNVAVKNGNIVIGGTDNVTVEVYSVNGQCIYNGKATTIPVNTKGLYIVKVGDRTQKVVL